MVRRFGWFDMVKTLPEVGRLRFLHWELNMIISLLVDNVYIGIFSFSSSREVTQDQQVSFSFIFWLEMTKIEAKIWTWTWLIRIWSSILTKINFSKCLLRKQIHGYLKAFHWWKELKPFLCINLKLDELFQGISSR